MKDLIGEAASNRCRLAPACAELEISLRTYQRWTREDGTGMEDGRRGAPRVVPANKLSDAERAHTGHRQDLQPTIAKSVAIVQLNMHLRIL